MILFEIPTKEFDAIFDYTFQEGTKIKLIKTNIIQNKIGSQLAVQNI